MKHYFAALDLGTNSILLLLTRADSSGRLVEELEACRITRLGESVAETGLLRAEAMMRTLVAVRDFLAHIPRGESSGVGVAVATSAARDAANGKEFLDACATLIGGKPLLFSGDEEAYTVFCGAASDQSADEFCVCLDIGGGSTEIAAGFPARCDLRTSLDIGCVRFAERFRLLEQAAPGQETLAREAAAKLLRPVCRQIRNHLPRGCPVRVIASGGTATTFAAVAHAVVPFERQRVHGLRLTEQTVSEWTERLLPLSSRDRACVPGLPEERAEVLPAGMLILSEVLRNLDCASVTVTTRGLRYGLALRLQNGELVPTWKW